MGGGYYISPDEDVQTVLQDLGDGLWTIYTDKQVVNSYTIITATFYDDNFDMQSEFTKSVYDSLGRRIAFIVFDSQTMLAKEGSKKFFYTGGLTNRLDDEYFVPGESNFGDGMFVKFSFDDNQNLIQIKDSGHFINNNGYWNNLGSFINDAGSQFVDEIMCPGELDYYSNLLPVEPNF